MKMAKASEADLRMALDLSQMLESFERGYFPLEEDSEECDPFDSGNAYNCKAAMELILDKLREGSLFRVVFGMVVLLDPRNECVDPDLPHIDHHPKTKLAREMHDELVAALRDAHKIIRAALRVMTDQQKVAWGDMNASSGVDVGCGVTGANARLAVLEKLEGR